jgi:hypothetical protein
VIAQLAEKGYVLVEKMEMKKRREEKGGGQGQSTAKKSPTPNQPQPHPLSYKARIISAKFFLWQGCVEGKADDNSTIINQYE